MYFRWMAVLFSVLLILTGCSDSGSEGSQSAGEKEETAQSKKQKIPDAPEDYEGIMTQNPGKFAGDNYDKEKVEKALDRIPDDMSTEKIYDYLIYLLGENYQPLYQKLQAFDTSIQSNVKTPEAGELPTLEQMNVEILLDASGSMAGQVEGGMKMNLAKEAIRGFVSELPKGAQVSLRVYGHKGSNQEKDKEVSCKSNELVYPFSTYDSGKFESALSQFQPTGWTPLASAIQSAHKDLNKVKEKQSRNVIYVVSDGVETCGGDPVKAAQALKKSDIQPMVNIVGFDVDDAGQKQLKQVAEAADGSYKTVYSESDLKEYLEAERERLEFEWSMWGSESFNEITGNWAKKQNELDSIVYGKDGIKGLSDREYKRLMDATEYLTSKSKVKSGEELRDNIINRSEMIMEQSMEQNDTITDELAEMEDKAKRKIDEQEDNMTN